MKTVYLALLGFFIAPLAGSLVVGLDRILTARLQSRIGPPLFQPVYDVVKLLGKEKVLVNVWQAFCAYGFFTSNAMAVVLFFLQSDLLLIFLIQAVGTIFLVVGALASTSPFSQIGGYRELLQVLSAEPLLVLVITGIYIEVGSFKIEAVYGYPRPLLMHLPLMLLSLGGILLIKLRKSPFDLSTSHQAHQELVKGVLTDYSGPYLALIEMGQWYECTLLLGLCSLFWATHPAGMLAVAGTVLLALIGVDNITARMNWRWMLGVAWAVGMSFCCVNLIWLSWG